MAKKGTKISKKTVVAEPIMEDAVVPSMEEKISESVPEEKKPEPIIEEKKSEPVVETKKSAIDYEKIAEYASKELKTTFGSVFTAQATKDGFKFVSEHYRKISLWTLDVSQKMIDTLMRDIYRQFGKPATYRITEKDFSVYVIF